MPIPNEAQVTYKDQAELDVGDMAIWENAQAGYSVISGGAVTEQGTPDGTVAVASGVAKVGFAAVTITAGNVSVLSGSANPDGSTSLAADSTQARFSLIVIDSLGRLGVLHGPNGGLSPTGDGSYTDVFPTFAGKTVLASVRILGGFTTVAASMLGDKRYFRTDGDFVARVLTPAALSANAADYAPTSAAAWAAANVLRQATNNSTQRNISGFSPVGHLDGKEITVINLGPGPLGFQNQNTGSAAANRFAFAADVVLPADRAFKIFYDVTATRWRAVGGQTPSGAPAILLSTAAAAGSSVYPLRDDATIVAFDATVPANLGTASAGSVDFAARRNHVHPADIQITFARAGTIATGAGTFRWYNDSGRTLTFVAVRASAGTAPTGATLIVDVNKDGTTIFTTQGNRPAIAISGNTIKVTNPDVTTIADASYLTVDVDQVGSTIAGSDLTVQIYMRG